MDIPQQQGFAFVRKVQKLGVPHFAYDRHDSRLLAAHGEPCVQERAPHTTRAASRKQSARNRFGCFGRVGRDGWPKPFKEDWVPEMMGGENPARSLTEEWLPEMMGGHKTLQGGRSQPRTLQGGMVARDDGCPEPCTEEWARRTPYHTFGGLLRTSGQDTGGGRQLFLHAGPLHLH